MGDNKTQERSFREIDEIWDQRDAPGWTNRGVEIAVETLWVPRVLDDGVTVREEVCLLREVGGRGYWLIPVRVLPAVVEGMRRACLYEHPGLMYSEGGHVVRKIMLNHAVMPEAREPLVDAGVHPKERAKLIVAVRLRRGKNRHGVIVYEKLVILASETHVLMVPVERIPPLLRLLSEVIFVPRILSICGSERKRTIGIVG